MATDLAGHDARSELLKMMSQPSSNGAVISGPIGSAKTSLLTEVLGGELVEAVHLLCSPVLGECEFGTLTPLLIDFEGQSTDIAVLKHLMQRFTPSVSGSKTLVVVEEAHFLDQSSAFVLSQLALAGNIRLLLLTVGQGRTEPVVASTEIGARLGRVSLSALSLQEVADYARRILGGPTTNATTHSIAVSCAGNPMLISAFLRSAREQGVLVESKGWYVLTQSHVENDLHLSAAVSEIQKRLNAEDATALEVLALGGAEEAVALEEISGSDIGRLLGTGLVNYSAESKIVIAAPLYAQILREIVPPGRSAQLWRHVSMRTATHGSLPYSLMWASESGSVVPREQFTAAIGRANAGLEFRDAWTMCRLSGALETDPHIALHGARAMMGLKRFQTVVEIVDRVQKLCGDPLLQPDLVSLKALALWHGHGDDGEIRELMRECGTSPESTPPNRAGATDAQKPFSMPTMDVFGLWVDMASGVNLHKVLDQAREAASRHEPGSLEYLLCRDACCQILVALGRFVEAADTAIELLEEIAPNSANEYVAGYTIVSTALRALFAVGDYAKIRGLAIAHEPESPDLHLEWSGLLHLWAAFAAVQEGRWQLAGKLLDEARAELAVHDPNALLTLAEALRGYIRPDAGGDLGSAGCVGQGSPTNRVSTVHGRQDATLLAAAYRSLSTGTHEEELVKLAARARAYGLLHTEQQLLILLWKSEPGSSKYHEQMARLHELAEAGVGRRNGTLSGAVRMSSSENPSVLVNVADELYSCGETGLGTELMELSLRYLEGTGNERQRGVVLRKIDSRIKELGGRAWGTLTNAMSERALTNREREIISLVNQGLSNKAISAELVVSQRTVEGHLYRIFAKLGISGRDELRSN
ncbi:LuxR C-terminal-related transcriptional regulator [Paeniglutamicibacter sp. R2-26]|uniref:helix-turn-helix transcriptional regulator n=1 Tax=Paeniglutamicibacter sp. R2-26 TaxID=3144417 RepID=UPI003EE52AC2